MTRLAAWRIFTPMLAAAEAGTPSGRARVAGRDGYHMRSDHLAAWELCARVDDRDQAPDPDTVFVPACRTSVLAMRGGPDRPTPAPYTASNFAAAVGDAGPASRPRTRLRA